MRLYESDELDPKTIEDVKELGGVYVSQDIPNFVDTRKARANFKFYFGLTTIRVDGIFENPNGKDMVTRMFVEV